MAKKRNGVYLIILAVIVLLVVVKQQVITAKRNRKIISSFTEWQEHGKPVVLKSVKRENVKLYTKITAVPVSGTGYEAYVSKTIQEKLRPGQSFYVRGQNGDAGGKVVGVAEAIDTDTGLFRVRLVLDHALRSPQGTLIVCVHTGTLADVICVANDVLEKEGDDYVVWVAQDGRARRRTVTLKQRDGYGAVIEKGLQEGDRVVVEGFTLLSDNDKLNVLKEAESREI